MKAIIASDIHGNLIYTQSLEELILKENPDKLILLGDYFSSYENYEVIDILNKYSDIICAVRGNCDYIEERCKFNGHTMYLKEMIEKSKGMYVLSGHTHVYKIHGNNLNPGSVGRPRENPEHTCLLYKNKTMYLIDLDNLNCIDKRNMP